MKANSMDAPQGGGNKQLHNVRFYRIKPRAIDCVAYNKTCKYLAVCREGASLELWNMQHAPYLDRVIHMPAKSQVEAAVWAGQRLFTVNLVGKLIEWNMQKPEPVAEQSPTGNALWCVEVNPDETELAVGSEEGHINIMNIENNEITFKSIFAKQKGRILCCKFDKSGKRLVTGCEGYLRVWDVAKGTTIHTMTLSERNVIVWSIQVLKDNTIITGDSAGYVSVWNGENATQIERQLVLEKNVFALAINEDENRLVCSGMLPPLIRVLSKTQIKREDSTCERWIKYLQRDVHKHYVKTLAMLPNERIVSGGQDGILTISGATPMSGPTCQHAPFLKGSVVSVAASEKLVLLRYPNSLHLWRLGSAMQKETKQDAISILSLPIGHSEDLLLEQPPQKLLQINVGMHNASLASALSPDGKWIAYSTSRELRIYRLDTNPLRIQRKFSNMTKKKNLDHIIFTSDSQHLLLLNQDTKDAKFYSISEDEFKFLYHVPLDRIITSHINHLLLSNCGKFLIAASSDNVVAIWECQLKKQVRFKYLLSLPRQQAGTTALAMHENLPRLVVSYADGRIVEYDLVKRSFTCETEEYLLPSSKFFCIKGIVLDPRNLNIFIVYDESYIYVLERNSGPKSNNEDYTIVTTKNARISKESRALIAAKPKGLRIKTKIQRQHLVHVSRLNSTELVNVSIQTSNLLTSLPAPYERKKFGES